MGTCITLSNDLHCTIQGPTSYHPGSLYSTVHQYCIRTYRLASWHPGMNCVSILLWWGGFKLFLMNFNVLKLNYLANVKEPISYRMCIIVCRSFYWSEAIWVVILPSSASTQLNSTSTQTKAEVSLISSFRQATQPPNRKSCNDSSFYGSLT